MKKNILLLGDYIVDEFIEDLCGINSDYKVSHIYILKRSPENDNLIKENKIEVIRGWHDYTLLIKKSFDSDILNDPKFQHEAFNIIKSLYRFSNDHDFFYHETVYYELINFWIHFFEKNEISLIIGGNPVYFDQIPILVASKIFGIKVITRKLMAKQPEDNSFRMFFFDRNKGTAVPLFYDKEFKLSSILYPDYSKLKIRGYPRLITQILKDLYGFRVSNILYIISNYLLFGKLKAHFKKISVRPNLEKNYIFYPLHFDPEVVTMPEENIRANQILNIRKISASLPQNWYLYVKIHPFQFNYKLNFWSGEFYGNVMRYYKSIESLKYISNLENVKIIDDSVHQKKLIKNSKAVASINGTVFLEASYLNKMILVLGKRTIYKQFSNARYTESKNEVEKAISELLQKDNYKSNLEKIIQDYTYDSKIPSKKQVLMKLLTHIDKSKKTC